MRSYEELEWARVALIATIAGQLRATADGRYSLAEAMLDATHLVELAEEQGKARTEHPTP